MQTQNYLLSFCLPIYNEEKLISIKIPEIQKALNKIVGFDNYEILFIENGSTDISLYELNKMITKNVRYIKLKKKGHGLAMREAILHAKGEYVLLSAIDLPFGFSDLNKMMKIAKNYELIYGSKRHVKSITYAPLSRRITSEIYRLLLKSLFHIKTKDTQGTVFIRRERVLPFLNKCNARDAFFSAQLAIFAEKKGLKIIEIPVKMSNIIVRKSKYNIIIDGSQMLVSIINEYIRMRYKSEKSHSVATNSV